jgi:hypothetical protein
MRWGIKSIKNDNFGCNICLLIVASEDLIVGRDICHILQLRPGRVRMCEIGMKQPCTSFAFSDYQATIGTVDGLVQEKVPYRGCATRQALCGPSA